MSLQWIPNLLSILRIILVAPILMLIVKGEFGWALALFFAAGLSDALDGFLATHFNWQSRLGALLDPVADKVLVVGMFVTMAAIGMIPVWLAASVILRDVVIVSGAFAYHYLIEPVKGEPTSISKLNTMFQLLFLLFVLTHAALEWPNQVTITLLGAATFVTVIVSGIDYVLRWSERALRGGSHEV